MVWECMRRKCVVQLWQTKSQLGSHLDLFSVIMIESPEARGGARAPVGAGSHPACQLGGEAE
jgi:hypothetical protein